MEKRTTGYLNITKVEKELEEDKDEEDEDDEKEQKEDSIDLRYELIYNSFGILINRTEIWEENLTKVKNYIDHHKKRPSCKDKNKTIKSLGKWLSHQSENYKVNKYIMKDKNTRKKWEEFINIYKEYFSSNEEIWKDNLEQVKEYIDQYKKRPSTRDKDKTIKSLGSWLDNQITNYKGNKKSMKEENIKKKWEDFIQDDKYKQYFK